MPMDFPDMRSLIRTARLVAFRAPEDGETEAHYREALADHMLPIDPVESSEIRTGRGWDKQTPEELLANIGRQLMKREDTSHDHA